MDQSVFTLEEAYKSIITAKRKGLQVKIAAELMGTTASKLVEALKQAGYDFDGRWANTENGRNAKTAAKTAESAITNNSPVCIKHPIGIPLPAYLL